MYKIVGGDGKEYGPVPEDQIRRWIREGRANAKTLIRREEEADWQPLEKLEEFQIEAGLAKAQAEPPLAAAAEEPDPEDLVERILDEQPPLGVLHCLTRGLSALLSNFFIFYGAFLCVWLVKIGLLQIPLFGGMINMILAGALLGGLLRLYLLRIRGESAGLQEVMSGFGSDFAHLLLAYLLVRLGSMIGLVFCILPGVYLYVSWAFSLILVKDKGMDFWQAMESSRKVVTRYWFQVFLLLFVANLPIIIFMVYSNVELTRALMPEQSGGFLEMLEKMQNDPALQSLMRKLVIGKEIAVIISAPFAMATLVCAYESLFGSKNREPLD